MLKIYMAPISNLETRTLQADGATWEALLLQLRASKNESLLTVLTAELPTSFQREDIIRVTLSTKTAAQVARAAGVSS